MLSAPPAFGSPIQPQGSLPSIGRTLVLCFDGTSDYVSKRTVTNVVRLFEGLEKHKTDRQVCYYQPGIGTSAASGNVVRMAKNAILTSIDTAFGTFISYHIIGGYRFLMDHYAEGDKICFFGFSRGAYTATCLAGMLHLVGLLPRGNAEQIDFAYALYSNDSLEGREQAHRFKKAASRTVAIEFMGLWDNVHGVSGSGKTLPGPSDVAIVKVFRQALALDERRAKFGHNPWFRPATASSEDLSENPGISRQTTRASEEYVARDPADMDKDPNVWVKAKRIVKLKTPMSRKGRHGSESHGDDCHNLYLDWTKTDHRDVWFAGSHSDVGGGESSNENKHSLSNPSLLWMIQQVEMMNIGIIWAPSAFHNIPTIHAYFGADGKSHGGSARHRSESILDEEDEKLKDGMVLDNLRRDMEDEVHDDLEGPSLWWLLEYVPVWKHSLNEKKERVKELSINRGRGREIRFKNPKFHISVQIKEEVDRKYKPRAWWAGDPVYVTW